MTRRHADHDVVVIGAGPAGLSVAAALEKAGRDVLVIEAGENNSSNALESPNFFAARTEPGAWRTDVSVRHTMAQEWRPYRQGRGFGGGAAVNGLVCMPGDEWSDPPDLAVARELMAQTIRYEPQGVRLGTALLQACGSDRTDTGTPWADGAGAPYLWTEPGAPNSRRRFATPAQLLLSTEVLSIQPGDVVTVLTSAGAVTTNTVVLCAGAIQTARLVMPHAPAGTVGNAVQDHPAIRLSVRLARGAQLADLSVPVVSCTARWRSSGRTPLDTSYPNVDPLDLQLLALDAVGISPEDARHGVAMVALMAPQSRGTLRFESDGSALLDLNMLHQSQDRARLRVGLRRLLQLLAEPPVAEVIEEVLIDDQGTPLAAALHLHTDDVANEAETDTWMMETAGDYSHVVGTCPAGTVTGTGDTLGLLHGTNNIWIADASLFNNIPTANTMVPTMVLARSVARRLGGH